MGSHIFGFWGKRVVRIYDLQMYQDICTVGENLSVLHSSY